MEAIVVGIVMMLSSIFGALASKRMNAANQQHEEELNEKNAELSRELAATANENERKNYNELLKPAAKLAQIKEAGLSPSTMYSTNSASSGTLQTHMAQNPGKIANFTDAVGYGNQVSQIGQAPLIASQMNLNNAEARKAGAGQKLLEAQTITEGYQAKIKEGEAAISKINAENYQEQYNLNIQESKLRIDNLVEQLDGTKMDNRYKRETINGAIQSELQLQVLNVKAVATEIGMKEEQISNLQETIKHWSEQIKVEREKIQAIKTEGRSNRRARENEVQKQIEAGKERLKETIEADVARYTKQLENQKEMFDDRLSLEKWRLGVQTSKDVIFKAADVGMTLYTKGLYQGGGNDKTDAYNYESQMTWSWQQ